MYLQAKINKGNVKKKRTFVITSIQYLCWLNVTEWSLLKCIICFRGVCHQYYINHMEGVRIRMNGREDTYFTCTKLNMKTKNKNHLQS